MTLRRTPLYDVHQEREARLTEFGGWEMPVQFDSIRTEHTAVRTDVGMFDVSHMGEIEVSGPDAIELCQRLTTNDVDSLDIGRAQYAAVTDEAGIMLDDIMLFRLAADRILFVPNAGTDTMMARRWRDHRDRWDLDADVENRTEAFGMMAVQGPSATDALSDAGIPEAGELSKHAITELAVEDITCLCARTGYTGENGYELLVPWDDTPAIEARIDAVPCGLGARDTLRLEMGYLLAGNEFDAEDDPRTPLEAGIEFAVSLESTPRFVGADALREQRDAGPAQRLRGIRMLDRGIPRSGYAVLDTAGAEIGQVTSGTMSPTLGEAIGLAYINTDAAGAGDDIHIDIRGNGKKARIEAPPFVETGQ